MKRSEFIAMIGGICFSPIKTKKEIKITSNSNADYMSFMTNGKEKFKIRSDGGFVINSSGNLGMGTPAPNCIATLDIKGNLI